MNHLYKYKVKQDILIYMITKYKKHVKYFISIIEILSASKNPYIFLVKKIWLFFFLKDSSNFENRSYYYFIMKKKINKTIIRRLLYNKSIVNKKISCIIIAKLLNNMLIFNYKLAFKIFYSLHYNIKIFIISFFFHIQKTYMDHFVLNNQIDQTYSLFAPIFMGFKWNYFYKFLYSLIIRLSQKNVWCLPYIIHNYDINNAIISTRYNIIFFYAKKIKIYNMLNILLYNYLFNYKLLNNFFLCLINKYIEKYVIIRKKILTTNTIKIYKFYKKLFILLIPKTYKWNYRIYIKELENTLNAIEFGIVYREYYKKKYQKIYNIYMIKKPLKSIILKFSYYIMKNFRKRIFNKFLFDFNSYIKKILFGMLKKYLLFFYSLKKNIYCFYNNFKSIYQIKMTIKYIKKHLGNIYNLHF